MDGDGTTGHRLDIMSGTCPHNPRHDQVTTTAFPLLVRFCALMPSHSPGLFFGLLSLCRCRGRSWYVPPRPNGPTSSTRLQHGVFPIGKGSPIVTAPHGSPYCSQLAARLDGADVRLGIDPPHLHRRSHIDHSPHRIHRPPCGLGIKIRRPLISSFCSH